MRYNRFYKENHFLTPTTYTQQLSEYVERLRFEVIPPQAVERAKLILIQTVGAALAASGTPIAGKVCAMAEEANGGPGGTNVLWGTGRRLAAVNAALVLGTLVDAADWVDCSWTGHPSAGAVPCAWIAAEERHRSGRDLLTAIVAGYEVYQRIAMAVQPSPERLSTKGWGTTSWQIFACIIPIAKLYGMDARRINQAIGMGVECSVIPAGSHARTMSGFCHYEHGYRARDGFLIAKSVEKGIHNQLDTLDSPDCYTAVICGDEMPEDFFGQNREQTGGAGVSWFTRDLGARYLIMDTPSRGWPAGAQMDCRPAGMMSREETIDRFRAQSAPVLWGEKVERAIQTLCDIEAEEDVAALDGLLY